MSFQIYSCQGDISIFSQAIAIEVTFIFGRDNLWAR